MGHWHYKWELCGNILEYFFFQTNIVFSQINDEKKIIIIFFGEMLLSLEILQLLTVNNSGLGSHDIWNVAVNLGDICGVVSYLWPTPPPPLFKDGMERGI